MSQNFKSFPIFIDATRYEVAETSLTGAQLKTKAGISSLFVDAAGLPSSDSCGSLAADADLDEVGDDEVVRLEPGRRFWSRDRGVTVTINRVAYRFEQRVQTGRDLKERASIPLTDVLFREEKDNDKVVPNEAKVKLKRGDCFHSSPPADYGSTGFDAASVGFERFAVLPQPDGWTFLVVEDFPVTDAYTPSAVRMLVKLPPTFPDGAPDMFWTSPEIRTLGGAAPQGTSPEELLGSTWQRFSWHLKEGAWRAGISTLRDFMRTIHARFARGN